MAEIIRNLLWSLSVLVLMSFVASDISVPQMKCEMTCAQNYSQNGAEIGYCCRGCRLMRMIDFTNYGYRAASTSDLLQTCTASCANAYSHDVVGNAGVVCQRGCQLELPAVANRLRQLQMFYNEQAKYLQMFDMISKLMSCDIQSLMYGPRQLDRPGDHYFRARVVFIDSSGASGASLRSISMSRGSETIVASERHEVATDKRKVTGRLMEGKSQLYARISRSDPAVVMLFLFGLVLLIGLSVSLCYPAQHVPPPAIPQKLSIYGDREFLSTLDEDDTLIDIKPRAQLIMAAPLPPKYAL